MNGHILLLAWLLKHCTLCMLAKAVTIANSTYWFFLQNSTCIKNHMAEEAALINLSPTRGSNSVQSTHIGPCTVCKMGPHGYQADVLWRLYWPLGGHSPLLSMWSASILATSCTRTTEPHVSSPALPLREFTANTNPSCTWWRDVIATQGAKHMVPKRVGSQGGHRGTSREFSGQSSGVGITLTAKSEAEYECLSTCSEIYYFYNVHRVAIKSHSYEVQ